MTTILITGATGTVGHQLATSLSKSGANVRAGVRTPGSPAADALRALGAEVVPFDMTDPDSVAAGMTGVDRVFLLTPFVEDAKPLVRHVVDAAKREGVRFILRMSASGADPESPLALAREHAAAESIVQSGGVPYAVIRPAFFMDNLISFGAQSIQQGRFYGAGGDGEAAYISTADIAKVAQAILLNPEPHHGKVHELTGAEAHSDAALATALSDALEREVTHVALTAGQHEASLRDAGLPSWMVDALVGLEGVKRNGWAAAVSPSVTDITGDPPEGLGAFLRRNRVAFG